MAQSIYLLATQGTSEIFQDVDAVGQILKRLYFDLNENQTFDLGTLDEIDSWLSLVEDYLRDVLVSHIHKILKL